MSEFNVNKEMIESVLHDIAGGYYESIFAKHQETVEKFIEANEGNLLSFSDYNHLVKTQHSNFEEVLLTNLLVEDRGSQTDFFEIEKLKSIYFNMVLIENHLSELIVKGEGTAFSFDKTRYVMNCYIQYLKSDTLPDWGSRNEYWQPKYGKEELWMNLVEVIPVLATGKVEEYIDVRKSLLNDMKEEKE